MVLNHAFCNQGLLQFEPSCTGHVAKLIGMPYHSRHVGQGKNLEKLLFDLGAAHAHAHAALKFIAPNTLPPITWQRVLASSGTISSRGPGTSGADIQRQALEAEGVEVTTGRSGDLRVNLTTYGWFPEVGTYHDRAGRAIVRSCM